MSACSSHRTEGFASEEESPTQPAGAVNNNCSELGGSSELHFWLKLFMLTAVLSPLFPTRAYFKTFVPQFQEAAFANGKL